MIFRACMIALGVAAALGTSAFAADPIRIGVDGPFP